MADFNDRLESWKEIAAYLGRDLRTVMRWEKERSLPVHRVPGGGRAVVYAYRSEIDAWMNGSRGALAADSARESSEPDRPAPATIHNNLRRHGDAALGSQQKSRGWRNAAVVALAVALLLAVALVAVRKRSDAYDNKFPTFVQHKVPIRLVNNEPEAVPGPFQQKLEVDSSRYTAVEAANLQNVLFLDAHGNVLKSWMESGNSRLAPRTIFWVELPEGIPASAVLDIYMGFADQAQNLFNTTTTGEGPGLSATYGQYDDGEAVFLHYANFAGPNLPRGWYSGSTPGGRGEIKIDKGAFLAHSERGGGSVFVGSDWSLGNNITEMDLLSQQTTRGQEMLFVCSANPNSFHWTANSVGYQDMSGLEVEANNNGTPLVLAAANPNPPPASVVGFQEGTVFSNYQPVIHLGSRICGGDYLASSISTGFNASFSFDWLRMRAPSPHGLMPAAIFGQLQ
jgi:predicted DNA-binding transcriptional regulator AlpA